MNKLEEYRNNEAEKQMNNLSAKTMRGINACIVSINDFKKGFDAAIALDLPVMFTKWKDWVTNTASHEANSEMLKIVKMIGGKPGAEELYKYWIENVYIPE